MTERGTLDDEIREVDEAVVAAEAAAAALAQVAELLGQRGQLVDESPTPGSVAGAISSAVKHDRLDQAQRAATRAEERLGRLQRELADVAVPRTWCRRSG